LTVDTKKLLARHLKETVLSPINSGCTVPFPHSRGIDTFLPVGEYPYEEWRRKRGTAREAVVELAVLGGVRDIAEILTRVELRRGSDVLKVLVDSDVE
jgi:hypothetical protein